MQISEGEFVQNKQKPVAITWVFVQISFKATDFWGQNLLKPLSHNETTYDQHTAKRVDWRVASVHLVLFAAQIFSRIALRVAKPHPKFAEKSSQENQ